MNSIIKKITGWTVYFAILVALVVGIPKAMAYFLKTDYPMAAITSGSMWPVLKSGDLVMIEGVNGGDEVGVGDIVVYRNDHGFTIHRVVSKGAGVFTTKGDANDAMDSPVPYKELIGKAVIVMGKPVRIPMLGNVSIFINKNKIKNND